MKVGSFPTLLLIDDNGVFYKYSGARTLEKFEEYLSTKEYLKNDQDKFEVPHMIEGLELLKLEAIDFKNKLHRFLDLYIFK